MSEQLTAGAILDGYHLIRFLGHGGFGEVRLCCSGAIGTYHAVKFVSGRDSDLIEKERHSLGLCRSAADLIEIFGEDVIRQLPDGVRPGWESDLRTVRDRHLSLVANAAETARNQPRG